MLRSMYSAISGLKNFQTQLDVIGNNIANVNTFGYKKSRVNFQDIISQEMSGPSAPTFNKGGINPVQVGLGSHIGSIDNIDTQGNLQTTGRSLDLAVSGDGYFMVKDGFNQLYTRAGNFYLDSQGSLVTSGGQRVLGYGVDKNGAIDTSKLTTLQINSAAVHQDKTSKLTFTGNIDDANNMIDTTGTTPVANASYAGKSISFKAFDSNQNSYDGSLTFNSPDVKTDTSTGASYVDSLKFSVSIGNSPTPQTGTVFFDSKGAETSVQLDPGSNPMTFGVTSPSGQKDTLTINPANFDLTTLTALPKVPSSAAPVGDVAGIDSFSIGSDGQITAVLNNGTTQTLGQVALATFNNPGGLEKEGGSLYKSTSNSGTAKIGAPGTNGAGQLQAGALEMSNVDLSEEFTGMIEAQRGFQSNARVITVADTILQELVDLKRN
jgi:flagellar hook protein FlgE